MKKVTDEEVNGLKPTKWYKKASFPWMIILLTTVLFIGIVSGWTIKCVNQSQVENDAKALSSVMLKSDK